MEIEYLNASSIVTVSLIIFGILFAVYTYVGGKSNDLRHDPKNQVSSTMKGDKKPKKKERRPKKANKKQDFSSIGKSDTSVIEENDDDDDDDRDDKNSPPPLEPITTKIVSPSTDKFIQSISAISLTNELSTNEIVNFHSTKKEGDVDNGLKKKKAKETPEQKLARLERQKLAKSTSSDTSSLPITKLSLPSLSVSPIPISTTTSVSYEHYNSSAQQVDGWAKVEDKRKTKATSGMVSAPLNSNVKVEEANSPEIIPVIEVKKSIVSVEARKVGVIIGPKGETLKKLQELFKVEIITPKEKTSESTSVVAINVSGSHENVTIAIRAIQDLCNKGYSSLLEVGDFMEGHISVPGMLVSNSF